MNQIGLVLAAFGFLVLAGCASGHCRTNKAKVDPSVFVYKSDGSKQCAMGTPVSLEAMAAELKDLKILSQAKKHDGKMYAMVCGGPTGQINVYEISASDLAKAKAAGFKEMAK